MATEHHQHDINTPPRGTMDITDHIRMWHSFWNAAKWSVVTIVIIAGLLAIFRTHNGY